MGRPLGAAIDCVSRRSRDLAVLFKAPCALITIIVFAVAGNSSCAAQTAATPLPRRTVMLGFDGMDPALTRQWMHEGILPNLAHIAEIGWYQDLPTTNPAQSPVAWSSFATGLEPGDHGVFDFLTRDPASYSLKSGIAEEMLPPTFDLFGWRLPLGDPVTVNRRSGTPFWLTSERRGNPASVLRVPVTYPPDPITRMLSGLGVPDLLGSQGTFTFYTSDPQDDRPGSGGRVVVVRPRDGTVSTVLEGPPHPLRRNPEPLTVPLTMRSDDGAVRIVLNGHDLVLKPGQWSDWIALSFPFMMRLGIKGMVRLYLAREFPEIKLYVSPIQIDPRWPVAQISSPAGFATELASLIGPYYTAGFPEETWSLNEERIDDHAYLSMVKSVLAEHEAMFFDTLARNDSALVVTVFVQTDRISHMFWRGIDPEHPRFKDSSAEAREAIRWIYTEADRIVGKTLARMGPQDDLIILSDHGFAPFRRAIHLNRWLVDAGLLALQSHGAGEVIDWSRTKAYAIGLNGIFINRRGREGQGVVVAAEVADIERRIQDQLPLWRDPVNGQPLVLRVYNAAEIYRGIHVEESPDLVIGYARGYRASWQTALGLVPRDLVEDNASKWSGDHTIDPSQVPGVLFSTFKPAQPVDSIRDVSRLIRTPSNSQAMIVGETAGAARPTLTAPVAMIADAAGSRVPVGVQIAVLAAFTATISMGIYRALLNRRRLVAVRSASAAARRQLVGFDGEISDLWSLIARNYRLAALQFGLVIIPAALSAIPAALMFVVVANAYDLTFPKPGEPVDVEVVAASGHREPVVAWHGGASSFGRGRWSVRWPAAGEFAQLVDHDGTVLVSLPAAAPIDEIRQRRWTDFFSGAVASLPTPGDVEAVRIAMPARQWIDAGPSWLRHPSVGFLIVLAACSLLLQWRWRL